MIRPTGYKGNKPMVYVHKYCIEYLNDSDGKMHTECGIAFGSTFSEVVHYLEDYYGKNNIESIRELTGFDVGGEYVMPESAFEDIGYKLSAKEYN